jgi:hypothetical protein
MKCGEQEVAAAISGEHSSSAIGAVRRWRQADDPDPGQRITISRNWLSPILAARKGPASDAGYVTAVFAQPNASRAIHDIAL